MLVFMNQDAYDKFRLSKEDYELQKELEKEQKEVAGDKTDDKKKEDKADEKKDEKPKDIVVELKGIQRSISYALLLIPPKWVAPSSRRMARPYIFLGFRRQIRPVENGLAQERDQATPQDEYRMGEHGNG